jgi:prophage maintenance system killer protein
MGIGTIERFSLLRFLVECCCDDLSVPAVATAYSLHICQNHAFTDGNKLTGAIAAIAFLLINNPEPVFGKHELADLVLLVAPGISGKPAPIGVFETVCRPFDDAPQ